MKRLQASGCYVFVEVQQSPGAGGYLKEFYRAAAIVERCGAPPAERP